MSKKGCELCKNPARMFCESDQASLCWECDEKVHGANFLVAKHSRTLLCHACRSPTPWKAAGPKLSPTVSICHTCADGQNQGTIQTGHREEDEEDEDSDSQESESDDEEYCSDSDDEEEEDGENQVVPWSDSSSTPSPPVAMASPSSSENASFTSLTRIRDNPFESEDEDGFCSSYNNGSSPLSLFRPFKLQKANTIEERAQIKSTAAAAIVDH